MIRDFLAEILSDERGGTAIEYALIAALVTVSVVTAISAMDDSLNTMFSTIPKGFNALIPAAQ